LPTSTRRPAPPSRSAVSQPTSPAGTPGTSHRESSPKLPTHSGTSAKTRRSTSRPSARCSSPPVCPARPSSIPAATPSLASVSSGATGATSTAPVSVFVLLAPLAPHSPMPLSGSSPVASQMVLRIRALLVTTASVAMKMLSSLRLKLDSGTRSTLRCWSRTLSPLFKRRRRIVGSLYIDVDWASKIRGVCCGCW